MTNAIVSDIHEIKPPMMIFNGWDVAAMVIGALVPFILLGLLIWWLVRRSRKVVVPPIPPAHARARQKLREALALIGQPKPFCVLVSDTIRWYLEERFNFRAPERTTEEFLRELAATDRLSSDQKAGLGRFLESCDLVKFAKYEPGRNELTELHGAALRLIDETEPTAVKAKSGKAETICDWPTKS